MCVCEAPNMTSVFAGTDGGRPMMLDGRMVLCSHSDPTFSRHYNGGISQLSIYDTALGSAQVEAIYNQVSRCAQQIHNCTPVWMLVSSMRSETSCGRLMQLYISAVSE